MKNSSYVDRHYLSLLRISISDFNSLTDSTSNAMVWSYCSVFYYSLLFAPNGNLLLLTAEGKTCSTSCASNPADFLPAWS